MRSKVKRDFSEEFNYRFSRSSGPGGQNVNKVSTRVEAMFSIHESSLLSASEKIRLSRKLSTRLTLEGSISVASQDSRSQLKNKTEAIHKLNLLLNVSLITPKRRIATKPGKAAKTKRLERKKRHGIKKANRRKPGIDGS